MNVFLLLFLRETATHTSVNEVDAFCAVDCHKHTLGSKRGIFRFEWAESICRSPCEGLLPQQRLKWGK